jgi:GAF domain-containing protein/CheY-like chemotaxis protein
VAKSITSILNPIELLQQTVDIICEAFDFYYAGVFLVDEGKQWAVLEAGYGQAGEAMLAEGHKLAVGGNSMIGAAVQDHQAHIALDVGEEAVHFKNPHLPETRSEMALPLMMSDEVIGALTVQSVEEAAFSDDDIAALQAMADQLAIAIHNSRLHRQNQALLRQAERRARLLEAANQVGKQVTSILEMDQLFSEMVDVICEAYGFYYAGVFLKGDEGKWARLRAGYGQAGEAMLAEEHKLEIGGNSMIGTAIQLGEARIALDVGQERVHFKNPHLPHTRSEMALPIIIREEVLGAVTVQSVEERAFSQDDIIMLQTMADHLAVAIQNARHLEELKEAHAELLRTKVYEALTSATTEAIHWIGNKALPISMTTKRLRDELEQGELETESLAEDLEMIAESAQMIVDIKEQLIGKAREQKPRPVMAADVVHTAAIIRGVPADKIEIAAAEDTPLVLADSTQLTRAVGNILQNSLEAEAENINVAVAPAEEDGYVQVQIVDDGCGIPEEVGDKIWATFYTTKGSDHHGLGLASSLHIVTQLQGRLEVSSKAGEGTTMTMLLPAASPPPQADLSALPEKIVLIDDEDAWAEMLKEQVAQAGKTLLHTQEAKNLSQAEVILVDEHLGKTSFEEIQNALKESDAADKTIILTNALQVEQTADFINAGFKDVSLKPHTSAEIAALLT